MTTIDKLANELKSSIGKIEAQMDSLEDRAIATINREASKIYHTAFESALKIVKEQAKEYINNNFLANSEHAKVNFGLGSNDGGKL